MSLEEVFLESCCGDDMDQVRRWLALGANVNWKRDSDGESGLHIAVSYNNGELLELLLSQPGVDVNITDNYNVTPLIVAFKRGHENIVRRLCQVNGVELNVRDVDGWTASHFAVNSNKHQCIEILRTLLN